MGFINVYFLRVVRGLSRWCDIFNKTRGGAVASSAVHTWEGYQRLYDNLYTLKNTGKVFDI